MPDVLVNEAEYAKIIAERNEYRAKLAAYEATDYRAVKAQADAALKLSARLNETEFFRAEILGALGWCDELTAALEASGTDELDHARNVIGALLKMYINGNDSAARRLLENHDIK